MGLGPHSYEFVESYIAEDPVLQSARARAAEIGLTPIRPGGGAALRLLASAAGAKAVVEVGTGTGVSGGWLLRGMRPDGVLTTIDIEPEHQRQARLTFREGGFAPGKTRLIAGRALDVLPRLADGAYDLVFIDGDKSEYAQCVSEAYRLLRPGGVLAVDNALSGGRVPDPAARDPESVALREVVKSMRDADEWLPALLPVGDGLLCAVKNGDGQR
jgi:predicted O-methyltransferase YrrM